MKWVLEYVDGNKVIEEKNINFNQVEKNNVKRIYFLDQFSNTYGLDLLKKSFFYNNIFYDVKINGDVISFFQFKNANYNFSNNHSTINSWNIGLVVIVSNKKEKYILSIRGDRSMYIEAYKNFEEIDEKKVVLKVR
jgi:hypothetical protein